MKSGIPTYAANGVRLRNYSLTTIDACLGMLPPSVVVKRNRRTGLITSAQFMPLPKDSSAVDGKEEIRKHAHMGQRYSTLAVVDDLGHRAWRYTPLRTPYEMRRDPDLTPADLERWLQAKFRAVELSCLIFPKE
jgi:hypothetical protein